MNKEDIITILEVILNTLKNKEEQPQKEVEQITMEPVVETIQQPVQAPPAQQAVQEVIQTAPIQQPQLPATGWDILRYNQQKIASLEEELNRMKMSSTTGIPMNQYPSNTYIPQLNFNQQTIGGSL